MSSFGSIDAKPKRFYKAASVAEVEGGWTVALDGRPIKTPSKAELVLPTRGLADVVAMEWNNQDDHIDVQNMHVTRLANVAIDRTPEARDDMAAEAARYGETDLVCHLASEPIDLREQQDKVWGPLRDWAGETLGVLLVPAEGVLASRQPDASLEAARSHARSLDDWRLTGLNFGLGLLGSVVLALAMEQGRINADEAFLASRIDENFQMDKWGDDEEAQTAAARRHVELIALETYFLALNA